jgi:hypothetical protein
MIYPSENGPAAESMKKINAVRANHQDAVSFILLFRKNKTANNTIPNVCREENIMEYKPYPCNGKAMSIPAINTCNTTNILTNSLR